MTSATGDLDDLPELTEKQEKFVRGIFSGLGVAAAFRASRDCSNMSDATIVANGTREHHNPNVKRWLRAAQIAQIARVVSTREEHEAQLIRLRELALEAGDPKAAINAEISRGKLNGFYVERIEHTVINPAAIIEQINAMNPRLAAVLAKEFNLSASQTIDLPAIPSA